MTTRIDPCAAERCRTVVADGHSMEVPRHVVRIEGKGSQGWQVRFLTPTRYFSDGIHGGVDEALDAACAYLKRIYRPTPKKTARGRRRRRGGDVGIALQRTTKGHWYVVANHPRKGSPRKFYIGTDETRTRRRETEGRRKAREQRATWLASLPVPVR